MIIANILRIIEIGGNQGVRHRVVVPGLRAHRSRGGVVGAQARGQALAVCDVDLEALAVEALLPVVVAGEEIRHPDFGERDCDGDGVRRGGGRVGRGPLDGVVVEGVVVVAELVCGEVVGLDYCVVVVRVENCICFTIVINY